MLPVRLRMASSDILCTRSMEVAWDDGTGIRHTWSSWNDELAGWYEAEKLLPSSATDICVHFKVRGLGGPWDVCRVNRRRGCAWVEVNGSYEVEEVWMRTNPDDLSYGIDAVFELKGPLQGCHMWRAWNAMRQGSHEEWEHWRGQGSRPTSESRPATLAAADGAAPFGVGLGNPTINCVCATKRMCAAARELLNIHRMTLTGLMELDKQFTHQWVGVNMGNTASAGLGVASAVLLFAAPPVGVGLGIGSAMAGGLAFAGDSIANHVNLTDLKAQLSKDAWNAFVVSELLREWMQARQALSTSSSGTGAFSRAHSVNSVGSSYCSRELDLGLEDAVDGTLTVSAVAEGAGAVGVRVADQLGKSAAAASQVLGIAGALISTGFAIRGWSTTKASQSMVRKKIADLKLRVHQIQHLLASVDRLECPICSDNLILADTVRHCTNHLHCFHAKCVQPWLQRGEPGSCPLCQGPLDASSGMLVDTVEPRRGQAHGRGGQTSWRSAPPALLAHPSGLSEERTRRSSVFTGCLTSC